MCVCARVDCVCVRLRVRARVRLSRSLSLSLSLSLCKCIYVGQTVVSTIRMWTGKRKKKSYIGPHSPTTRPALNLGTGVVCALLFMHVSSSSYGTHVSSSSQGSSALCCSFLTSSTGFKNQAPPQRRIRRALLHSGMYPPPHMTCMYPLPHMSVYTLRIRRAALLPPPHPRYACTLLLIWHACILLLIHLPPQHRRPHEQ
jgi:hypothetical protein